MMMNNMFSMFDPSSSFLSASWLILMLPMLAIKLAKSKNLMKTTVALKQTNNFIKSEMNQLMEKNLKMSPEMTSKLFLMVMSVNLMAIFPFNFTPTAHMMISFPISLTMWTSTMMYGWMNQFKNMMAHLTPLGTPNNLMNFMVLIESISSLIRPITLSIRLSANMVAGHLLMSLLSSFSLSSTSKAMGSLMAMVILTSLELMVAMVQAYVITTLLVLYQNENT